MLVHIIDSQAFLEGGYNACLAPLCGSQELLANLIPLGEIAYMDSDYISSLDICQKCQEHPDFVLMLLGALP